MAQISIRTQGSRQQGKHTPNKKDKKFPESVTVITITSKIVFVLVYYPILLKKLFSIRHIIFQALLVLLNVFIKYWQIGSEKTYATLVSLLRLVLLDTESNRVFIREYDAYCTEIRELATQLTTESCTEIAWPANLNYCVNRKEIKVAIDCGFVKSVGSYKTLTD